MKANEIRYGVTAFTGSLAISAMTIAAESVEAKWIIACVGSAIVGFLCSSVIPYGDKP